MSEGPINPDREQQRADNIASRRQSGLEPMPKDREPEVRTEVGVLEDGSEKRGEGGESGERAE